MKKFTRYVLVAAGLAVSTLAVPSWADTLNFDDLPRRADHETPALGSYHGFDWDNWYYVTAAPFINSGYYEGTVSGPNASWGTTSSFRSASSFNLLDLQLTSAWNDGLMVSFVGSANGIDLFSKTVLASSTAPSLVSFDWMGIDRVRVVSSGGIRNPNYGGEGTQFVVDDIRFTSAVPETESYWLLLLGLVAIGLLRWRKHFQRKD